MRLYPALLALSLIVNAIAQDEPLTPRERKLMDRVSDLEKRLDALEKHVGTSTVQPLDLPRSTILATGATQPETAAAPSFASGATLNLYLDGYYGWNFNHPAGRVNLLRSNDVLSNNFTLNQVGLILERAPDVAAGRRYGARVDLMWGQNTETLQGAPQNEPRPRVYRNVFQAYGSYVLPVGAGLQTDFGKFYSALGIENNYAYHEINYSRSFYFNFLPFYHMGFRSTYNFNDKLSFQYWLVNGANQTEDFNGWKSNVFLFTVKPAKSVSWNLNYYTGQENRSMDPIAGPKPNGRTHIFDTYATWNAGQKLLLAGEFDYVVARPRSTSVPSHVIGGAAYAKYQFTPKFSVAGRFEYLSDRGGLFSGATQALKEHTLTATYQPADGVQFRLEYRRDYSNRPFFLQRDQNTATLGTIWWFGGKRDSW